MSIKKHIHTHGCFILHCVKNPVYFLGRFANLQESDNFHTGELCFFAAISRVFVQIATQLH